MKQKLPHLISGSILACAISTSVQAEIWQAAQLPQAQETVYSSQETGETYRIQIARVGEEPPKGYPVIYLLDGDTLFAPALVMANSILVSAVGKQNVPVLLVGIGYSGGKWLDLDRRAKDYTPLPETADSQERKKFVGAASFGRFIDRELKPLINSYAKTRSDQQAIVGHSFGGLFGMYSLIDAPDRFQYYVLSSPSLWWQNHMLMEQMLRHQWLQPLFVRLSVGGLEQGNTTKHRERAMIDNASAAAHRLQAAGIATDFAVYPGETHGSVQFRALQDGLAYLGEQWCAKPTIP